MKHYKIFLLIIFFYQVSFAHKEWVHKYVVIQAYEFLKLHHPSIIYTDFNSRIGDYSVGCSHGPWQFGNITAGAYREDCEDVMYHTAGIVGQRVSITHFWDADAGDNSQIELCDLECWSYDNAYKKALHYINGSHEVWADFPLCKPPDLAWQAGFMFLKYNSLVDLYKNKKLYIVKFVSMSGETKHYNPPVELNDDNFSGGLTVATFSRIMVWEILGRVAHLLADMSVPAHAKNDKHPCDILDPDGYELYMGGNDWSPTVCNDPQTSFAAQNWTASTAQTQGGLIDISGMNTNEIIRYLFYTQNQLSDHFPSGRPQRGGYANEWYNGDNNLPNGSNQYLITRYSILGPPPNSPQYTFNYQAIADETFNFCIRATATLFYWFAVEACLLPAAPTTPTLSSPNNGATCIPNSTTLRWNRAERCPTSYHLQVSTNNWFSNIIYENSSITGTSQTVSSLSLNTTYYWRVSAINGTGNSNWSSTYSFQTKTPPYAYSLWADKFEIYRNETATITLNVTPLSCIESYAWGHRCSAPTNQYEFTSYTTSNRAFLKNFGVQYEHQTYYVGATAHIGTWQSGAELPIQIILKVGDRPPPPPPPSCPFVFTWDGTQFHEDNNILPQSEYPGNEGKDVIDFYRLLKSLRTDNGKYILQIREFENERSYLDQFTLLAIDHPDHTKIDISEQGEIFQYVTPFKLDQANLKRVNVLNKVISFDSDCIQLNKGDTLNLSLFKKSPIKSNNSIEDMSFGIEAGALALPKIDKIASLVGQQSSSENSTYLTFRQRMTLSFIPLNVSNLNKYKLAWHQKASLDYINFALRVSPNYDIKNLSLLSAMHSITGDVISKLNRKDSIYSILEPGQSINLAFEGLLPPPIKYTRTFILVTQGRYEKIGGQFSNPGNSMSDKNKIKEFSLTQNYPDPFKPITSIRYDLPIDCSVKLIIYDLMGRDIATLVDEYKKSGTHSVEFDISEIGGLPSGVYFYRLQTDKYSNTKKMLLLK